MTYLPTADLATTAPTTGGMVEVSRTADVRVLAFDCQPVTAAAATADRFDRLSIVVVAAGSFCYADHGYTRLLEPGAVVLGCPGDGYRCSHPHGGGDRGTVVQLSDSALLQLQADLASRSRPRPAVFAQAPRPAALAALALAGGTEGLDEAAFGLAASVLGALEGGAAEVPPSLRPADRDRAHAAAQLIERRYAEALDLQTLAAAVATSPFHFLRAFRQELGLTPHQYLLRTRVRHAALQLATTDLPITAIALEVGFGDLTNFIRAFRAHMGETPTMFRRRCA